MGYFVIISFSCICPPVGDLCTGRKEWKLGHPDLESQKGSSRFLPKSFQEKAEQEEVICERDLNMSLFHTFRMGGSNPEEERAVNPFWRSAFPPGIPACGL